MDGVGHHVKHIWSLIKIVVVPSFSTLITHLVIFFMEPFYDEKFLKEFCIHIIVSLLYI
jgi:hypothetical protein